MMNAFGNQMKELRINCGLTLREFCRNTGYDPSNWSKIERGLLNPPGDDILSPILRTLGVEEGSIDERGILDLAAIARNQLPADIKENENALSLLPAFFRTVRGEKPSREQAQEFMKFLKQE